MRACQWCRGARRHRAAGKKNTVKAHSVQAVRRKGLTPGGHTVIWIDLRNIVKSTKIRNRRCSKAKYHLYKLKTYTKKTTPCIFFFPRNVHFPAHTPNTLEWGPFGKSEMGGGIGDEGVGKQDI